jgi:hypothetical protein
MFHLNIISLSASLSQGQLHEAEEKLRQSYNCLQKLCVSVSFRPLRVSVTHFAHRLGDLHEDTDLARQCLARCLRVQSRESEAREVERVKSWSKRLHGGGAAADAKHKRDDTK